MSTQILPINGISFPVDREIDWDTDIQEAISGYENRLSYYTYPRYTWTADIGFLSSSSVYSETLQALLGFVNQMQGQFNTFLYADVDDYTVTGQAIGTGTGSQTNFQLVRGLGGAVDPIFAPNLASTIQIYGQTINTTVNVYLNGVLDSSSNYTVYPWNTSNAAGPGVIVFNSAPGNGVAVTADFTYYWPCRFATDKTVFSLSFKNTYKVKKLSWKSCKN